MEVKSFSESVSSECHYDALAKIGFEDFASELKYARSLLTVAVKKGQIVESSKPLIRIISKMKVCAWTLLTSYPLEKKLTTIKFICTPAFITQLRLLLNIKQTDACATEKLITILSTRKQ